MADIKKLLESIDRIGEKQSTPKQNNPVAKNAMATVGGGGYGKHKDKKKDEKVGKEKHKGSFMKDLAETADETKELRKIKESWKQFRESADILSNGTTVRIPHNGKMVTGKIVRYDKGSMGGTPFYVVDIGEYGSERVSVHNVKIAEAQDYRYHKKGLENETFYKNVLDIMNDSSSESAEEAMVKVYGMMRKNDDPEAWESQVNTIVKLYNKVNDIGLGDSPADKLSLRLKEYGPQTTDPNAQSTNPDNQGGVTAPQQNKNTQQYKSVQQNSPSTVGTNVDTMDDPDTFINFMKDSKFANTLKTNKSFADQLKKAFSDAGYK